MPQSPAMKGLRSAMTVNVTAPAPKQTDPWPANVEDILIGKDGADPTGFVQAPGAYAGTIPKIYSPQFETFSTIAPALARRAPNMYDLGDPMGMLRKVVGLGAYVPGLRAQVYTEPPSPERMAHETIHKLQMENFPNRRDATKAWNPRGPGELAYLDAPGEQQAYKVEELLRNRTTRPQAPAVSPKGTR